MYFTQPLSILFITLNAFIVSIIPSSLGFIIGKSNPADKAKFKYVLFKAFLFGTPNDIFDTPNMVFTTILMHFKVSNASSCWAETVNERQSINISFFFIP